MLEALLFLVSLCGIMFGIAVTEIRKTRKKQRHIMRFGNHLNIEITVKVADLIAALKANREKHVVDYHEACAAYLEKVRERLAEFQKSADAGMIRADN